MRCRRIGQHATIFELMGRTITLHGHQLASGRPVRSPARISTWRRRFVTQRTWRASRWTMRSAPPPHAPARFLGIDNERGMLKPGARADIVALTSRFEVAATWVDGAVDSDGHTQ